MNCVKAKDSFSIKLDRINGYVSTKGQASFEQNNTLCYVDGVVIHSTDGFIEDINNGLKDFSISLDGSFSVTIVQENQIRIITDRSNSHKVFYSVSPESIIISNSIDEMIRDGYTLDVGAVANFITNNCLINDKTIFTGVNIVPGGSIASVDNSGVFIEPYFSFEFDFKDSEMETIKEIQNSLIDGIEKCFNAVEKPVLALSGGWDARSILYIFSRKYGLKPDSFTYKANRYDSHQDTDADISAQIANDCGSKHEVYDLYSGDFIDLLEKNAKYGKCISAFCYEITCFLNLASKECYSDIIFGDHIFGYGKKDITIRSKEDVLQQISVFNSKAIKGISRFFSDGGRHFYKSLDDEVNSMFNKANNIESFTDKKDYLYFEQRVKNLIMPLRQMIGGLVGFTYNPYLLKASLNICQHIPTKGRIDKTYYKKALLGLYPELFSIPYAQNSGRDVDWALEICLARDIIIQKLENYPKELEQIFPKKAVLFLLDEMCYKGMRKRWRRMQSFFTTGMGYLRRRFDVIERIAQAVYGPHVGTVSHSDMLINVLYIREYLEIINQ